MKSADHSPFGADDLEQIYRIRFAESHAYRNRVWQVLTAQFFQRYIALDSVVLDLGCGYGEFINNIRCATKYAMDLNQGAVEYLDKNVVFLRQSCASPWEMRDSSLDAVFTSNFFEHLPDKGALSLTLDQAARCLKPGGQIICLGPNIKCLPGRYWDFWDHHLPLTELSLREGLETHGFAVTECHPRFLPYTMIGGPRYPLVFVSIYLRVRLAWRFLGRQFLVIGRRRAS